MSETSPNTVRNWYVSRNDKQIGPYPAAMLKQLAATGKILPTDLVWKDGSDVRNPASQIKGLFPGVPPTIPTLPNQVTEPRNLPPPLPRVNRLASGSKTESTDSLDSNGITTPTSSVHVSLWSPIAIFIWSFFLSPLFGSYLLYRNWEALGKSDLARRSLYWFYSYVGLFILVFLGVWIDNELILMLCQGVAAVGLIAWMIKEAAHHVDYVKKNVGKAYERKSILKPLGVFVACAFLCFISAGIVLSQLSSSQNIALIKTGSLPDFGATNIETITSNFLNNPVWTEGVTSDGTTFVNVNGTTNREDSKVQTLIQFFVDGKSFHVNALELDRVPQNKIATAAFFVLMFEEFETLKSKNKARDDTSSFWATSKSRVTAENYEKINDGMTIAQVEKLLGKGDEVSSSGSMRNIVWTDDDFNTISIVFIDGKSMGKSKFFD